MRHLGKWLLRESECIVKSPWVRVERNSYATNDRDITDYYIVRRKAFVLVVANTEAGVILVRQYRPATDRTYLALPAGYIEQDENILEAGTRELAEETGYAATNSVLLGQLDPLPGYIDSPAHVVWCDAHQRISLTRSEEIDGVQIFGWSDIEHSILTHKIVEMQAVSALLLARLWRSSQSKVS